MPTSPNWPSSIYPRAQGLQPKTPPLATAPIPVVPQDGQQSIAAGATKVFTGRGDFNVFRVVFDFPVGMLFSLSFDGTPFIAGTDAQGRWGDLSLGDFTGPRFLKVGAYSLTVINSTGGALDCFCSLLTG